MDGFRGPDAEIGTSFSDSAVIDRRLSYDLGVKGILVKLLTVYPLSKIFNSQVLLTQQYYEKLILSRNLYVNNSSKISALLERFSIPEHSNKGSSIDYSLLNSQKISNHYLDLAHQHSLIAEHIDFKAANSFFEIGGGFGANVHFLVENYPNLKKFLYLDIAPNLYVASQYLRSFYGNAVVSYSENRNNKSIEFNNSNELEIICIAPQQIENLNLEIDIFQNSHSFVEMTNDIVRNYAFYLEKILKVHSSIALVSYDSHTDSTLRAIEIPNFFNKNFQQYEQNYLWDPLKIYYFFLS